MIAWGQIILLGLQLLDRLLSYGQERMWIKQGQDEAIAKATAEILRKSNYAKAALKEFEGKSDSDIDDFLRSLEPGKPDSK